MGAVAHCDPPLHAVMLDLRSKHQMLFPQCSGCGLQKKGLTMGGGGINGEVKGDNGYYVTGNPTVCCQSLNASANAFPNQHAVSE